MSWFARTIANTLNLDDEEEKEHNTSSINQTNAATDAQTDDSSSPLSPGRGVKEDLSEITKTLSRQFWGVASFLAPPPPSSSSDSSAPDPEESEPTGIPGIRSDFAEIGGRFKSGISKLAVVSEITTKMAADFLQLGSDDEEQRSYSDAVGVTDDVVAFVRDIAMHPRTWLDFPLPDHQDNDDFDMSDAQQEHALVVERLAPRLAALRMELCPVYMSEACFWKIYFVLLHPRLEQHDAEILSTYQILEARSLLTHDIKNCTMVNPEQDSSSKNTSAAQSESVTVERSAPESVTSPPAATSPPPADFETEKHPVISRAIQIVDKSIIEEGNVSQENGQKLGLGSPSNVIEKKDEDNADDWLKEESSEKAGSSGTTIPIDNDEDVSFSDLEEDEGDDPTSYKKVTHISDSSVKDKRESNDWLDVDDIDVA